MSLSITYMSYRLYLRLKANLRGQRKYMVVQHKDTKEIFFLQAYDVNTFDTMLERNDLSECIVLSKGYFKPIIKVGGE